MKDKRAELLKLWDELSDEGRNKILEYAKDLYYSGNYKKPLPIRFTGTEGTAQEFFRER